MILILGGTSEGVKEANTLKKEGQDFIITVATEYGLDLYKDLFPGKVELTRFTKSLLRKFIQDHNIHKIIDCTHPYAKEIKSIAKKIAKELSLTYIERTRPNIKDPFTKETFYINSIKEAGKLIKEKGFKHPLFATGSKDLSFMEYLQGIDVYVRMLPYEKSIINAVRAGIPRKNIIAIQGPFSKELNKAIIDQYGIDVLVTKDSGKEGGLIEKLQAAKETGIPVILVKPS